MTCNPYQSRRNLSRRQDRIDAAEAHGETLPMRYRFHCGMLSYTIRCGRLGLAAEIRKNKPERIERVDKASIEHSEKQPPKNLQVITDFVSKKDTTILTLLAEQKAQEFSRLVHSSGFSPAPSYTYQESLQLSYMIRVCSDAQSNQTSFSGHIPSFCGKG